MSPIGEPTPPVPLQTSLTALLDEASKLRGDVHSAEVARRRSGHINMGLTALLAVLVALVLAIGWQNNRLTEQTRETAAETRETNKRIADCSTPGGRCYEEGRQRTSGAIDAVVRISIFVSQCGRLWPGESGPEYDAKLTKCVAERLQAAQAQPAPSPSR